ncbi:N-acetylglutaminylglutamine synthetase [Azohydromonas caseinilytica]|uniref:N-acetylglutaminylglutamine synthetase n=1 Tax=Azohydromonas caseinilytica TaxID=2728836 RepID=A0A848FHM1_9BURK|nr:N-acetylglutaminylglutamine synthetase [Azohydromonas caseinilytica]NML18814.1 N-acetylglutaminylglutamine synthetase [Azohydromonas caseinilytica]
MTPLHRQPGSQPAATPTALHSLDLNSEALHFDPDRRGPVNAWVDCGWGRLLFGPSFDSTAALAQTLLQEAPNRRDIALYVESPQLVLAEAPNELFLDPSLLFRRPLDAGEAVQELPPGIAIRPLATRADIAAINRLYRMRGMVPLDPAVVWVRHREEAFTYMVAEDERSGDVVGTVLGLDHVQAFGDAHGGSSLWCLAVDPQSRVGGVGQALVRHIIGHFAQRGRRFLDLSVMHDNGPAIALYEKLGFAPVTGFVVKRKNAINQRLFDGNTDIAGLNIYARLIVNEARRRGIGVDVIDAPAGIFKLRHFGNEILCRESLTDLTGGVAMTWCQDKQLTLRRLASVGLRVPQQQPAGSAEDNAAFLRAQGSVVVKPALGEQGRGISVDIRDEAALAQAVERAAREGGPVVLEEFCQGQDLRIVVIGYRTVAAAIRRPAEVLGDGRSTVRELIERQSARRAAATSGESRIPMDGETERCLADQGLSWDSVLPEGQALQVRKTANLHTGGTIHDVTPQLHPQLREAAEAAARALRIPVVGLDFLVPSPQQPEHVIIEANERPGLANHEPQPTVERFVDLLFPETV